MGLFCSCIYDNDMSMCKSFYSVKQSYIPTFLLNSVKILKLFHVAPKSTHHECQWNLLFYNFHDINSIFVWLVLKQHFSANVFRNVGHTNIRL